MRTRLVAGTALISLSIPAGLVGCSSPTGSVAGRTFSMTGFSFDDNHVADVSIQITNGSDTVATLRADNRGRFHAADLPTGKFLLHAACGHGVAITPITINQGRTTSVVVDCSWKV
jgi:hypothetical protein